LTRSGALVDVGVLESSNSYLLDDAAVAAVRRGVFEPLPNDTWVDEEQHKFSAEIAFNPPGS
ncbi:MAG: energy transducer TonB family protein, partial [Rhodoferax sp.]